MMGLVKGKLETMGELLMGTMLGNNGGQQMVVGNNWVDERNNMNNKENNGGIMGAERTMKAIRVIVKVIQGFPSLPNHQMVYIMSLLNPSP
jgi:hypothetical protein